MIKALVAQIKPGQRPENIPGTIFPSLGRFVNDYHAFKSGNEVRVGFQDVDTAKLFARELAATEPGKIFGVLALIEAFECPPGDIKRKILNDAGELRNDE